MKMQIYIQNQWLILEEDLEDSFKTYRVHFLTRMQTVHTK